MSDDDKLIGDFFDAIPVRRRGKAPLPVHKGAAPSEATVNAEELNLFNASTGCRFKCGICGKSHKSSHRSRLKSIGICIDKIKYRFGEHYKGSRNVLKYTNRNVEDGVGVRFLPDVDTAEILEFTYKSKNVMEKAIPGHDLFEIMHPKLFKEVHAFRDRLDATLNREIVEQVSLKEALGAPATIEYIEVREKAFEQRAKQEVERLKREQLASDSKLIEKVGGWASLKPEKFKAEVIDRNTRKLREWYGKESPDPEPASEVKVNGKPHDAERVLAWFDTLWGNPVWDPNLTNKYEKYLFDIGLWAGVPAISWGIVTGKEKRTRNGVRVKGSTIINFVSVWNDRIYLNMFGGGSDRMTLEAAMKNAIPLDTTKELNLVQKGILVKED